jgi:hypothetical protein
MPPLPPFFPGLYSPDPDTRTATAIGALIGYGIALLVLAAWGAVSLIKWIVRNLSEWMDSDAR